METAGVMIVGWEGGPVKTRGLSNLLISNFNTDSSKPMDDNKPRTSAIDLAAAASTGDFLFYIMKFHLFIIMNSISFNFLYFFLIDILYFEIGSLKLLIESF